MIRILFLVLPLVLAVSPAFAAETADTGAAAAPTITEDDNAKTAQPASDCAAERCADACDCRRKRWGAAPFVLVLFNEYPRREFGGFSGPSVWSGVRGFAYLGPGDDWRLGAMVAGGTESNDDTRTLSHALFNKSTKRSVTGGFVGFTAEYVFNAGGRVEVPLGMKLGAGGSTYLSRLPEATDIGGIQTNYTETTAFLSFMPMLGVEANLLDWLRVSLGASYLLTQPLGETRRMVDGFCLLMGFGFGNFKPRPSATQKEPK